ncbi:MAG TPA: DJ-1/PfpI family protein [Candidatus Rifleibacterium sp.]|nr:DJ-1/PfpI family protein [Candidatus Rifleibacterium sp.]HPT48128.1 DJ-1/PfpI family protein [Candidatus Rifleibacterium sp.]
MTARAVVFMAPGFEEMELTITVDVLRRAGIDVQIASLDAHLEPITGSRGIIMLPDTTVGQLDCDRLDLAVLPGGVDGTKNLGDSDQVLALLKKMHKAGKKIAAICAAPAVLVKAGLLVGRNATSHPAASEYMQGVNYREDRVVVDGNITTSRAAGTTFEFAFALVEQLVGKKAVAEVNEGILARI